MTITTMEWINTNRLRGVPYKYQLNTEINERVLKFKGRIKNNEEPSEKGLSSLINNFKVPQIDRSVLKHKLLFKKVV